jgi:ABC-type antimicrobial peptide transport system permease subunit
VSVRASLGEGRWRLMRQFLTENVVLSLMGGFLGVGVGYGTMVWLKSLVPPNTLPQEAVVTLDTRVLLFTFGVSVLVGILFGLVPALQATKPDLSAAMKEGGRGSTAGSGRKIMRDALVVAEIAVAFVLLAGSGLLIRSFVRLIHVDTGMNTTSVLTFGLPASDKQYPDLAALNSYYGMTMSVRTNLDPASLEKSIRQVIAGVNHNQPLNNVRTLQRIIDSATNNRMEAMLLTIFSGIALVLASIGIYGVLAYAVAQRTHELGVRAALGASRSTLLTLVLARGLILALIGLVIGLGGALGLTQYISTILYNVSPRDPVTLAWIAAVLAGVALLACYIPARRATKVDPMVALRYE